MIRQSVCFLLLIAAAAIAPNNMKMQAQDEPKLIEWPKDWTLFLDKDISIEGAAVNAKLGALLTGKGEPIWIDGLESWPEGYYLGGDKGKRVRVAGKVIVREDFPTVIEKENEPHVAGVPASTEDHRKPRRRFLLKDARWKLAESE